MLPCYFDYIFVHVRQKVRLRPEISPKFLSTLGPNPTRKARPDLQLCFTQREAEEQGKLIFQLPSKSYQFIFFQTALKTCEII